MTVDYRYDRFGRLLQDGELTYTWDGNGNPATLGYPGGVTAVYGYDYADRPASLLARRTGQPDQPIVAAASYLPSGPLASLTLGNGLTETRSFTTRYFPSSITLGSLLSWSYTTDKVGNVSTITDTLNAANSRTFGYQDTHYFLTRGDGPWGPRSWTYDRIGNRLTEARGAATDTYVYQPGATGGHSPILSQVQSAAGIRTYQFGLAGHLEQIDESTGATDFINDDAGRLAGLAGISTGTAFRYDGRGFLTLADADALPLRDGLETGTICAWSAALGVTSTPACPALPAVHPTYSSAGLLHALQRNAAPDHSLLFHFAGRPVAQLDLSGSAGAWKYFTNDHLGIPIAATSAGGGVLWQGGFEPFGADWNGAAGAGVFLRLPGQWKDLVWTSHYNLERWYDPASGRYFQAEPIILIRPRASYVYAFSSPLAFSDPDGREPKPSNGVWCGSDYGNTELAPPCPDCSLTKGFSRLDQVLRLREKKCSRRFEDRIPPTPGAQAVADIDWGHNGKVWVVPQGDGCVDHCLCVHENYHLKQVLGMVLLPRPVTTNALECDAYDAEVECISGLLSKTIRVRLPFR